MKKAIIYNLVGALIIIVPILLKIPVFWVVGVGLAVAFFAIINPFTPSVEKTPKGFEEKQFKAGGVTLNYVEGPDNGPPLLFIPGQMEFWQGYKLVMSHFAKKYHVYVVDVRGHGKSSRTPGDYSYNSCGKDLKIFLEEVVGKSTIVSGLSSGAVLALWLGANAPKHVATIIAEDPPLFSSLYPRIQEEKYMFRIFQTAIDTLGKSKRDILAYFMKQGIPKDGKKELLLIPPWIAKFIVGDYELNKKLRPQKRYNVPMAPFSGKVGFKFLEEYDVDFSKATIDGRLSDGFDPIETLKRIVCPVLLIQAKWSRHEYWGLLGALDDNDVEKIRLVTRNLTVVKTKAFHDVHLSKPKEFILLLDNYLPVQPVNTATTKNG